MLLKKNFLLFIFCLCGWFGMAWLIHEYKMLFPTSQNWMDPYYTVLFVLCVSVFKLTLVNPLQLTTLQQCGGRRQNLFLFIFFLLGGVTTNSLFFFTFLFFLFFFVFFYLFRTFVQFFGDFP